jgi:hypothetical protein
MAQTLSQYIGAIRQNRDNEMAQKLQSLLPLLQQKQAMEKQEAEKTKQREETMGYLGTVMGKYGYQPEEITQFKAETAAMPTEQLGSYFNMYHSGRTAKQDLNTWGINAEGMDLNQVGKLHDYTSKAIQLGDEALAEYKKSIEAKEAPEVAFAKASGLVAQQAAQAKRNEYLFQQANKKFAPKSGGGTGGGTNGMDVNEQYRVKVKNTLRTDADGSWVSMYHGDKLRKLPAKVGKDGRLYIIGEKGTYEANPFDYPDYDKNNKPEGVIIKSFVDKWNGAAPSQQAETQETPTPGKIPPLPPSVRVIKKGSGGGNSR